MIPRKCIFALVMVLSVFFLFGCVPNGAKTFTEMSPQEKVTWMLGVYNSQYEDYQSMTGHTWNGVTHAWEKTSSPNLSEDQKGILRKRREILTKVYPLIQLYDAKQSAGVVPDRETEQKIIDLLNKL